MKSRRQTSATHFALGALLFFSGVMVTPGCQVSIGGQTLPSAHYMTDDIQYFPKGPEFKLSREAAAQRAARAGNPDVR